MSSRDFRCVPAWQLICAVYLCLFLTACGGNSNSGSSTTTGGSGTTSTPTPGSSNTGSGSGGTSNTGGSSASSNTYLYAGAESDHGSIDGFRFDQASGVLTPVPGSPFNLATGNTSEGVVAAVGGFVYTMNSPSGNGAFSIYTFKVDASTGSLTQSGNPVPVTNVADGGPRETTVSNDGQILYIMTQSVIYAVAFNGGSPVLLNSQDVGDVMFGIAQANGFLFAGVQNGNPKSGFQTPIVRALPINPNGSLGAPNTVATLTDANIPRGMAADPAGKFVAVTTGMNNSEVSMYAVTSSGALTPVAGSPFSNAGGIADRLAFDDSGQHLYVLNNSDAVPNDEAIVTYSVQANGALAKVQSVTLPVDVHQRDLVVSNNYVFVTNNSASQALSSTITVLRRDAATGQLTLVGTTNVNGAIGEASLLHQ